MEARVPPVTLLLSPIPAVCGDSGHGMGFSSASQDRCPKAPPWPEVSLLWGCHGHPVLMGDENITMGSSLSPHGATIIPRDVPMPLQQRLVL